MRRGAGIPWGTLINASLDAGLEPEDALLAVLGAARIIEDEQLSSSGNAVGLLTPRERELMEVLADGCDQATAAARMGIQPSTVKMFSAIVRRKLGARTTRQAVEMVRAA